MTWMREDNALDWVLPLFDWHFLLLAVEPPSRLSTIQPTSAETQRQRWRGHDKKIWDDGWKRVAWLSDTRIRKWDSEKYGSKERRNNKMNINRRWSFCFGSRRRNRSESEKNQQGKNTTNVPFFVVSKTLSLNWSQWKMRFGGWHVNFRQETNKLSQFLVSQKALLDYHNCSWCPDFEKHEILSVFFAIKCTKKDDFLVIKE